MAATPSMSRTGCCYDNAPMESWSLSLLRHPNCAVVIAEIAVLPLAFGFPVFAALFTLTNLGILAVRLRAENAVLDPAR